MIEALFSLNMKLGGFMKKLTIIALIAVMLGSFSMAKPAQAVTLLGGLDFSPAQVNFPNTIVGETSAEEGLRATHNGIIPLVIFIFRVFLVDNTHFRITSNGCNGAFLFTSQHCDLNLVFTPAARRFYISHLTYVSTSFQVIDFVRVTGKGVVPRARVRPSTVDFGNQTIGTTSPVTHVRVRSVGTGPLTVSALDITSGASVFTIDSTDCFDGPIPPRDFCSVNLTFSPDAVQDFTGELDVVSNAQNGTQVVDMTGAGTPVPNPAITLSTNLVDFEDTQLGMTSDSTVVTVTSSGNVDVNITDILTDNATAFPLAGTCITGLPLTLTPGSTCDLDITFAPDMLGLNTSNITFLSDATDEPDLATEGNGFDPGGAEFGLSSTLIDFGQLLVGVEEEADEPVIVSNNGTAPLRFTFEFGGEDFGSFGMHSDCPTSDTDPALQPGETCEIIFLFLPQTFGELTAGFIITDSIGGSQNVALRGEGIGGDISGAGGTCGLQPTATPHSTWLWLAMLGVLGLSAVNYRRRVQHKS